MLVTCPHCDKDIDLVGAKELREEFGIGPNSVAHARERGLFPVPWLSFANRNIWVRDTISSYVEDRSRRKVESTVQDLLKALDHLPEAERKEAAKRLAEVGRSK